VQTGDPETLVSNPSDDSVAKIFKHICLLDQSEASLSHSNTAASDTKVFARIIRVPANDVSAT
ncbi:MAG: hypothetical protein AAF958_14140, partial [Planctomycetota bacterium]